MKKNFKNFIKSTMMLAVMLFAGSMAQTTFAANFTTPFTTPANYTNDTEIEVAGGLASLKESSLLSGLQGYWKMNDASGQITDSSGKGNHGTNNGATYGVAGKLNTAMSFDGVNDYIGIGAITPSSMYTVSFWVKLNNSNWVGSLFGFGTVAGDTNDIYFWGNDSNKFGFNTWNTDSWGVTGFTAPVWTHIVAEFHNNDFHSNKMWINGVAQTLTQRKGTSLNRPLSNNVGIGYNAWTTVNQLTNGRIDEVAVFNRALTTSEITELYNAGNGKELEQYSNGTFTITKTAGNTAPNISGFTNFAVTKGVVNGSLAYQLSTDGTNWKYWDGSAWGIATTQANYETVINTNISSFPSIANSIYVKTFMTGDGTQEVEVDEIQIGYNTNSTPTNLLIDGANTDNVNEGTNTGTPIATLTTTDSDTADTHTYTLVNGTGDEDNTKFQITGDQLKLNFTPDYENPTDLGDTVGNNTYTLRIETNDGHGGTYQKSFIITINDLDENKPVITLNGASTINLNLEDSYTEQGATALDDVDGDISANIVITGGVNTTVAGTYIINYDVADTQGNQALTVTRTIIVNAPSSTSHHGGSKRISKERLAEIFGKTKKEETKKQKENKLCSSPQLLHQNMRIGDRNGKYSSWQKEIITEVKLLQAHMNRLGFNAGPEDGILGPLTRGAIKRMQLSLGFTGNLVDAMVGPLTREKINYSC